VITKGLVAALILLSTYYNRRGPHGGRKVLLVRREDRRDHSRARQLGYLLLKKVIGAYKHTVSTVSYSTKETRYLSEITRGNRERLPTDRSIGRRRRRRRAIEPIASFTRKLNNNNSNNTTDECLLQPTVKSSAITIGSEEEEERSEEEAAEEEEEEEEARSSENQPNCERRTVKIHRTSTAYRVSTHLY
jgi:hypothetical protein